MLGSLVLALAVAGSGAAPATFATPAPTAFLTYESGALVGVDWVERRADTLHTRSVLMQSHVADATIELRSDGTAARSSVWLRDAGSGPMGPISRSLGEGAVAWSDMIPSTIEDLVRRARLVGRESARIPIASLYREGREEAEVSRVDSTDWVLVVHGKRYLALTDPQGDLLSATLPDYGVTIERRAGFAFERYPLWAPDAAPPDGAYRAEDVSIHAPEGHVLAGTLTIPPGRGPFPAAVLITGLSPNDRNEGRPPWMALRDLADAYTRRGIVVLRVDDRGVGASTGDRASSTTFDEATDVETEVAWLRSQARVDRRRVALVGYSEGGLIAPMVAAGDSSIAAIVTLAGPGVPGPEVARYQIEAAVDRDSSVAPADRETAVRKLLADTLTVRERSYLSIDPMEYARRTRCPALIVQGGNDLHVPVRSAERLAWAMRAGGNRDVSVRIVPGVSHSLLQDPGGLNSGWVYLPGFLTAPEILRSTADWLADHLASPPHPPRARRR